MTCTPNKLTIIAAAMLISACSSTQPKAKSDSTSHAETSHVEVRHTEIGQASFYANKHQKKKTASGELYDQNLKTAAHRKLPFGTMIKITNTTNGKSVVARVNDRGPHVKGRIVDLSKSAFSSIADAASGVISVKLEVVE
jgi:rare lipoprotein A